MSLITLQFGQCGNQIGYNLFSNLYKDLNISKPDVLNSNSSYCSEGVERWFRTKNEGKYVARSVLVDTEQKAIHEINRQLSATDSLWKYDQTNIVTHRGGGSGNNWAYGYGVKGPELKEIITERVRKEVEKCDRLLSILNLLSTAGGTGSGVGSYIMKKLQDEYPTKSFINAVVLPYTSGDVIVQNYNTVLTLANLYDVSDMFIVFQNDHLHKMNLNLLKNKNCNVSDLNDLIGKKVGSLFQPLEKTESCNIYDIISHLTPHPQYKFITIKTAPHCSKETSLFEANIDWNILVDHMKQTLRISYLENEPVFDWETRPMRSLHSSQHSLVQYVPCISNLLLTRGSCAPGVKDSLVLPLNDDCLYAEWIPRSSRCLHLHQNRKYLNMDKFISLATNNSLIHYPVNNIVEKAWTTYMYQAYLHQYSKFGIKEEDFIECFAKLETIIKTYKEL